MDSGPTTSGPSGPDGSGSSRPAGGTDLFQLLVVGSLQDGPAHLVHLGLHQLPAVHEAGADRLHQLLQNRAQEGLDGLGAQLLRRRRDLGWRKESGIRTEPAESLSLVLQAARLPRIFSSSCRLVLRIWSMSECIRTSCCRTDTLHSSFRAARPSSRCSWTRM